MGSMHHSELSFESVGKSNEGGAGGVDLEVGKLVARIQEGHGFPFDNRLW
jgi:hypothetical protein